MAALGRYLAVHDLAEQPRFELGDSHALPRCVLGHGNTGALDHLMTVAALAEHFRRVDRSAAPLGDVGNRPLHSCCGRVGSVDVSNGDLVHAQAVRQVEAVMAVHNERLAVGWIAPHGDNPSTLGIPGLHAVQFRADPVALVVSSLY